MFGAFRVKKITILRHKIIFFPILGGAPGAPPPLDPPLVKVLLDMQLCTLSSISSPSRQQIRKTAVHMRKNDMKHLYEFGANKLCHVLHKLNYNSRQTNYLFTCFTIPLLKLPTQ